MRKPPRGLSLVELMVGSMLVFSAACALAEVLASSSRYVSQERNRSVGLQLTWMQSEDTLATFIGGAQPVPTVPPPGFGVMSISYQMPGVNTTLQEANLTVILPDPAATGTPGATPPLRTVNLQTFSHFHSIRGVVASNGTVAYVGNWPMKQVHIWRAGAIINSKSPMPVVYDVPSGTPFPPGYTPPIIHQAAAGLAADPSFNTLWASNDLDHWGLKVMAGNGLSNPNWPAYPSGTFSPSGGCCEGLTMDAAGNVWVADSYFRQIWCYTTAGQWQGPYFPTNPTPRLLIPTEIAMDNSGRLYVADQGAVCLRYLDNPGSLSNQSWSQPLRPALNQGVLGTIRGMVWGPTGLLMADAANWWLFDGVSWTSQPLPPNLKSVVDGLGFDPSTGFLWVNAASSTALWTLTFGGGGQFPQASSLTSITSTAPVPPDAVVWPTP